MSRRFSICGIKILVPDEMDSEDIIVLRELFAIILWKLTRSATHLSQWQAKWRA